MYVLENKAGGYMKWMDELGLGRYSLTNDPRQALQFETYKMADDARVEQNDPENWDIVKG